MQGRGDLVLQLLALLPRIARHLVHGVGLLLA